MNRNNKLENLEGQTLAGKYRLHTVLGSGGMGYVYQAEQLGLGRSVAIKLLNPESVSTGLDWFRAEAMAASRINHPHAVAIYDFGVTDDQMPYLVMEHLRGDSLAALIEHGALDIERLVELGAQVLSALSEAHECGVVHCDLTSDNIIVERLRDGEDFAKVIDFGLARTFGVAQSDIVVAGTPEYMSPEQIRGEIVGPPTDIYAVGVLLYEMIVGRPPFVGSTIQVIVDGHVHAPPIKPHEIVPECPELLGDLVMWALQKDPTRRPSSADEMRDALLSVLGAERVAPVCGTCNERATFGQRYCGSCGAQIQTAAAAGSKGALARGSRSIPRQPAAKGKGKERVRKRTTRLTCDFDRATATLLGREQEIKRVTQFCGNIGAAAALGVVGPPGIGKARVLLEARRALEQHVPMFLVGADPSGMRSPWYPILTLLEQLLETGTDTTMEDLTSAIARVGLTDRDVPGLALLFGIEAPAQGLELAVRKREAHAAALRTITSVRRRFPRAVLCFADIDEYDGPSRSMLDALCRTLAGTPIRVVVSAVSKESLPFASEVLELEPLEPEAALELARKLTGGNETLPSADVLHQITDGIPAAVEQLAGWVRMGHSPASAPSLLVDLVTVRVNNLPSAARRVLQAVAIHGTVVPRWLVAQTLGEAELVGLDNGWSGLLVIDENDVTIPLELVASVMRACTPADVRRNLNIRALAALEGKATKGILGHHAEHAGELDRAYQYFLEAGAASVERFDDAGAASWYGRALAVARARQAQGSPLGPERCIDAAILLGTVLHRSGASGLAVGVLDEAELFEPTDAQRAAMERARGLIAVAAGDPNAGVGHFRISLGLGLRAGDRDLLCETYIDLSTALRRLGQTQASIDELRQGLDVITMGEGMPHTRGPRGLWRMGLHLAERCFDLGNLDLARTTATKALEQARRHDSARGRGRLSALLATIYEGMGDPSAALRHRAHAIDEMRTLGDRRSTAELLLDSARASQSGSFAAISMPALQDPRRGMRIARKLAKEIGWREGVEQSRRDDDTDVG